jgi:hypothetical protein
MEKQWRRQENEVELADFLGKLVEAAGVEPASEGPSSPDSTCLSSFVGSQPAWERG